MYFNVNCVVLDAVRITIGPNVLFGPGGQHYAATHPLDAAVRRTLELAQPITIGDDCWFGGGAVICPGVTIGEGCVIGAGAVVPKDVLPYSLAMHGQPGAGGAQCGVARMTKPKLLADLQPGRFSFGQ